MDGFEIGDPVSGALTSRFNVDATRGVEVQAANISTAYPHSGASILSLETFDGDDRWRFGTTNPAPGINIQEGVHLGNWYPRFTFSGPLERGKGEPRIPVSQMHYLLDVDAGSGSGKWYLRFTFSGPLV